MGVKQLDTVTLVTGEPAFVVKKACAIAAKMMAISTNRTQHNMGCAPGDIKQHPDLTKAAFLAELLRWTSKNQALRRQPRRGTRRNSSHPGMRLLGNALLTAAGT